MPTKKGLEDDQLLEKVKEIRSFFKFGDEIIPFLGDLFKFLREIMPLMAEVSQSLHDTTNKLPTASDRISDVSRSTEMATHEILDKLDSISETLYEFNAAENQPQKRKMDMIHGDINDIIYALQFQDITSQKLEHANRILEAILEKFSKLFISLENVGFNSSFGEYILNSVRGGTDDDTIENRNDFHKKTEDVIRSTTFSQDDIDSLFD